MVLPAGEDPCRRTRTEPMTVAPRAPRPHFRRGGPPQENTMSQSIIDPTVGTAADADRPSRALWGDRSLKTKVLSTVAVSAAVAGTIGVLGLTALGDSAASAQRLYENNLVGAVTAAEM